MKNKVLKFVFILSIILISLVSMFYLGKKLYRKFNKPKQIEQTRNNVYKDYSKQFEEAEKYIKENNLSSDFFILVDLSLHSRKDRMMIYNIKEKKVEQSFLTMHGSGLNSVDGNVKFSNEPKSYASSKGKYILSTKKTFSSNYGEKYLLYGKENTNSNALKRSIVLHHSKYIPNREVYPKSIGRSRGCPAVSIGAFSIIDKKIKSTNKNVLLWIID